MSCNGIPMLTHEVALSLSQSSPGEDGLQRANTFADLCEIAGAESQSSPGEDGLRLQRAHGC